MHPNLRLVLGIGGTVLASIFFSIVANLLTPPCRAAIARGRDSWARRSATRAKKRLDQLEGDLARISSYVDADAQLWQLVAGATLQVLMCLCVAVMGLFVASQWATLPAERSPVAMVSGTLGMLVLAYAVWRARSVHQTLSRVRRYDEYSAEVKSSMASLGEVLRDYEKRGLAAKHAAEGIVIHHATYGAGDTRVDVTEIVRQRVSAGQLQIRVSNELVDTLGGDPLTGVVKELVLEYSTGGEKRTVITAERDILLLP